MDRMEDEDLIEILCAYVAVSDGLRDEMFLREGAWPDGDFNAAIE